MRNLFGRLFSRGRKPTPMPPGATHPENWILLFFVTRGGDGIFRNRVEYFDSELEALEFLWSTSQANRDGFRGAFKEIPGFNDKVWELDHSFRGPERLPPLTRRPGPHLTIL